MFQKLMQLKEPALDKALRLGVECTQALTACVTSLSLSSLGSISIWQSRASWMDGKDQDSHCWAIQNLMANSNEEFLATGNLVMKQPASHPLRPRWCGWKIFVLSWFVRFPRRTLRSDIVAWSTTSRELVSGELSSILARPSRQF